MSLQFIIGSSGSGKTRLLYENLIKMSMEDPDGQFIVIVPEQFTMQTQKEIVTLHPRHGTMNIDIVSFERLAYRIFEELGIENPEVLDDCGKSMILRKVAASKSRDLGLYAGHLDQTGFINELKSMLSELYQYGISPKDLRDAEDDAGVFLKEKLRDICTIYEAFQDEISERFITSEEILDVLCRVIPDSSLIKNSVVTLDGYTGFTPIQYRIIEQLMICAKQVIVTVTIDPSAHPYERGPAEDLFHMGKEMIVRLDDIARQNGIMRDEDIRLSSDDMPRFKNSPGIAFIEKALYRYGRSTDIEPRDVLIYRAATPGREVEEIAYKINSLVKESGLRYREIAVITGDLEGYKGDIVNCFHDEGIPFFMDDKKSILENVMVEFIRSALEAVRRDLDYESMFRYLKTGLVTDDDEELDRIENYVIALGIRGFKMWNFEWDRTYNGAKDLNLVKLNEFRSELISAIGDLKEAVKGKDKTVREMNAGVIAALEACNVKEKLERYAEYFDSIGEYSLAGEYTQVYDRVIQLFERFDSLLGDEKVTLKVYEEILDAGFEEIEVGVIPATVDRVIVGDIERTRLDSVRALFLIGVNEGIIPNKKDGKSLLTDADREKLKKCDIELAPTTKEDGFMQRYYLYLMLTKPSDLLVLSYSSADRDGKPKRPSGLINEIRRIFLNIRIRENEDRKILSEAEGRTELIDGLINYADGKTDRRFLELYRYYLSDPDSRAMTEELTDAAFYCYEEKGLSRAAARSLYGKTLEGSVTRLERYASCAYAHFLSYGLELMEREEYQIEAYDTGNLFHDSIELCFKKLQDEERNVTDLSESERKELVHGAVSEIAEGYGNTIFTSSARNLYLAQRIERMTDRTIWALSEQLKMGDFIPSGFEVPFSSKDNLKAMKIRLSEDEQMFLKGRIDRLDLCEDEGHVYIKIIDYKSGNTSFDLPKVYFRQQIQLVVYMDAVLELEERKAKGKEVIPAGIFYYNIKDPIIDKTGEASPDEIRKEILKQLRMNGLVNSDLEVIRHLDHDIRDRSDVIPVSLKDGMIQEGNSSVASTKRFELLRRFIRDGLKKSGQEILNGSISVKPYKDKDRGPCDYCPYHSVCEFDVRTKGFRYGHFPPLKASDVWDRLEDDADGLD